MEKQELITLVRNAQKGDSDALSELFAAYRNEVYSIAMQQTKNRTLSEDVVQETFLEVILKIEDLKQPASFPAWLKVLTYHQCTRYYKKKETIHEVSVDGNEDGFSVLDTLEETNAEFLPDEAVDQAEFRATILGMVDALPDAQRAALQMFYYEQMPLKVIAKVQGVSVNTANTRLNRGRIAVKDSVETYEKKHGIRLHTLAFFPFFRWLFRGTKQVMPEESAALVAQNIAAKTGVELGGKAALSASGSSAPAVSAPAAGANTAAAVPGAAAKTAAGAKVAMAGAGLKAVPTAIATKIIAGVAAVSVAAGGVAVYQPNAQFVGKPVSSIISTQETIPLEESITKLNENAVEASIIQEKKATTETTPIGEAQISDSTDGFHYAPTTPNVEDQLPEWNDPLIPTEPSDSQTIPNEKTKVDPSTPHRHCYFFNSEIGDGSYLYVCELCGANYTADNSGPIIIFQEYEPPKPESTGPEPPKPEPHKIDANNPTLQDPEFSEPEVSTPSTEPELPKPEPFDPGSIPEAPEPEAIGPEPTAEVQNDDSDEPVPTTLVSEATDENNAPNSSDVP